MLGGAPHTIAARGHRQSVMLNYSKAIAQEPDHLEVHRKPKFIRDGLKPLQTGLVPFQVRSLVQISVEARSASIVKPGEHWKLTVWLYVKSLPSLIPLAGTPGSPQLMTGSGQRE